MTTKHTPGPWTAILNIYGDDRSEGDNDANVSVVNSAGCCTREDAHLIAAAPDLLEALEGLYNAITDVRTTMEDLGHAEEAAAAAIAKAKP